jgi:O-antigen/teichoic acid export membrane protein
LKARLNNHFKDDLLRHTAILFSGMMVVHASNLAFQMLVSRKLPEIEYALLTAFLAALAIISYPLLTLTTGLGHYCSLMRQENRTGDIKRLLGKWMLLSGLPALALGSAAIVFHIPVSSFLHLDRAAPVIIAGAVLPALFWFPVLNGAAQGLQLFGLNSASAIFGALLKLIMGAGLVWFWHPACGWAMVGHSAGIYLSVAVLMLGLFVVLRHETTTTRALPSLRLYLGQSLIVQIAFAILMNADVILVKHFLPDDTAFPYAATLGRIVAFLPGAIGMAMFPKVASTGGGTREHQTIFLRSLVYTGACVAVSAVACLLAPGLLLRLFFGITDAPATMLELTRIMTLAMAASALLNTVMQYLLAQRNFAAARPIIIACAGYLITAYLFRDQSASIATAAAAFNGLALVACIVITMKKIPTSPSATEISSPNQPSHT